MSCNHNPYWRGNYGTCKACENEDLREALDKCRTERDEARKQERELRALNEQLADVPNLRASLTATQERLGECERECEKLRAQLAGCGVAALQNTRKSAMDRAKPGEYGWSGSYGDVCKAVDREISLREERDQALARAEIAEALLATIHNEADIYRQEEDGTRQWCPELSIYLRGNVGMAVLLTPDEFKQLEEIAALRAKASDGEVWK